MIFVKFDEGRADLESYTDADSIKKFVAANQLPLTIEFSDEVIRH